MKYHHRSQQNFAFGLLPSDEELVVGYLIPKLCQLPLPSSGHVIDCDLYGQFEPWEIWSKFGGHDYDDDGEEGEETANDMYFFTPLKKMAETGMRYERSVGTNGGTWNSEDARRLGQSRDGVITWEKKRFRYLTRSCTEKKRKRKNNGGADDVDTSAGGVVWIMHEYRLSDKGIPFLGLDRTAVNSCVLCRLRRKKDRSKGKGSEGISVDVVEEVEVEEEEEEDVVGDDQSMAVVVSTISRVKNTSTSTLVNVDGNCTTTQVATDAGTGYVGGSGGDDLILIPEEEGWQFEVDFFKGIGDDLGNIGNFTLEKLWGDVIVS